MGAVVYSVSTGSYSDYEVCRIFATDLDAQAWLDANGTKSNCFRCGGTGQRRTFSTKQDGTHFETWIPCPWCEGEGDKPDYFVEEFPYGPEDTCDE